MNEENIAKSLTPVFMFPGQTSRDANMIERVIAMWPEAAAIVEAACSALDRDIAGILQSDNPFACNRDIQVAVFLCSHVYCVALEAHGVMTDYSLGLSLGEYNHLVHIGAIDFLDALRLVDQRGRCYDESPAGKMAAVMPLDTEDLDDYLNNFGHEGILEIANYNSPTQHVVAGEAHLVDQFVEYLEEEAMAMCFLVDDKIPMHTHVMDPVAESFLPALTSAKWRAPTSTYRPGVDTSMSISDASTIPDLLQRHVHRPIYFYQALETLLSELDEGLLIEVGPENTLYNLIRRCRSEQVIFTDRPDEECVDIDAIARQFVGIDNNLKEFE